MSQSPAKTNTLLKSERLTYYMEAIKTTAADIQPIIELMTIPEAARRIGVGSQMLRRNIASKGVHPDGVIIAGSKQIKSPLFVAARLPELARLVNPQKKAS